MILPFGLPAFDWKKEGPTWPLHEHSRFVEGPNVRWHVQEVGEGPTLVALHGTAATTHSLAPLARNLQTCFRVFLVDLPGHGFSTVSPFYRASIDRIAVDLSELMRGQKINAHGLLGHSAGAPLALALAQKMGWQKKPLIAINGAFKPFDGMGRSLAPLMARALHINPLSSLIFANGLADKQRVRKIIEQTGSIIDDAQLGFYHRALSSSRHVAGALGMMAHWNLENFSERIDTYDGPLHLFVGGRDKAVSPREASEIEAQTHNARVYIHQWPELGHLLHEENPRACAAKIQEIALT